MSFSVALFALRKLASQIYADDVNSARAAAPEPAVRYNLAVEEHLILFKHNDMLSPGSAGRITL